LEGGAPQFPRNPEEFELKPKTEIKPRKTLNFTKGRGFEDFLMLTRFGQACDPANSSFLVVFVTFVVSASESGLN